MPIDNTATIKDIIAKLQSLEGINAKADLASVVGSPATEADSMATINSVIQSAKNDLAGKMGGSASGSQALQTLVGDLSVGKKWASGSVTSSSSTLAFSDEGSGTVFKPHVTVSGLDFTPSGVAIYRSMGLPITFVDTKAPLYNGNSIILNSNSYFKISGNAYLNEGFRLPITTSSATHFWVAYE
jgi:hypothetical protein